MNNGWIGEINDDNGVYFYSPCSSSAGQLRLIQVYSSHSSSLKEIL